MMGEWSRITDPTTFGERTSCALDASETLSFDFPVVVDGMQDEVAVRWSAAPERLFVVETDGRVVYTGGPGPFEFNPGVGYEGLVGHPYGISLEGFLEAWTARDTD